MTAIESPPIALVDVADELCLLLARTYIEAPSGSLRQKLKMHLVHCSSPVQLMCQARLSLHDEKPIQALECLTDWIDHITKLLSSPPLGDEFSKLMQDIKWLDEYEDYEEVQRIFHSQLLHAFRHKWPHSAATLTLDYLTDSFDEIEDIEFILQGALNTEPDFWPARIELANAYVWHKRFADAFQHFQVIKSEKRLGVNSELDFLMCAYSAAQASDYSDAIIAVHDFLAIEPDDDDAKNMLANCLCRHHRVQEAIDIWLQLIPQNPYRRSWLWVTRSEYFLDEDGEDRTDLNPLCLGGGINWSCHKDTKAGDLIFLYRTRPCMDIAYLLVAGEDAEEVEEDGDWSFMCESRVLLKFDASLSLSEMRESTEMQSWSALKRQFQGKSFKVPPQVFRELLRLIGDKLPDIRPFCDELSKLVLDGTPKATSEDED